MTDAADPIFERGDFEEDKRATEPYISYDTVRVEVEFGLPRVEKSGSAASA